VLCCGSLELTEECSCEDEKDCLLFDNPRHTHLHNQGSYLWPIHKRLYRLPDCFRRANECQLERKQLDQAFMPRGNVDGLKVVQRATLVVFPVSPLQTDYASSSLPWLCWLAFSFVWEWDSGKDRRFVPTLADSPGDFCEDDFLPSQTGLSRRTISESLSFWNFHKTPALSLSPSSFLPPSNQTSRSLSRRSHRSSLVRAQPSFYINSNHLPVSK
jgi:hypothetical protein